MKKLLLPLLLICLLIHSCSRLDIAIGFANTYVTNKADDYFDLTKEQTKWLRTNFEKDFLKVQKIIFPQLAAELMRAADIVSSNKTIDTATLQISYDRLKNLVYDSLRIFSANAVLFADKLQPNQVVVFQKEFDKKMRNLNEDESEKDSYKKMKKQFDSWLGSLSAVQKNELENFNKANPPLTSEKVFSRQLIAHEFVSSFPDRENRKRFVTKLTTQFDQLYEGKFSKATKERNSRTLVMVASILNKMSTDQRKTLVDTLRDRATQLIKISRG